LGRLIVFWRVPAATADFAIENGRKNLVASTSEAFFLPIGAVPDIRCGRCQAEAEREVKSGPPQ
jgi:hypothetical protein